MYIIIIISGYVLVLTESVIDTAPLPICTSLCMQIPGTGAETRTFSGHGCRSGDTGVRGGGGEGIRREGGTCH